MLGEFMKAPSSFRRFEIAVLIVVFCGVCGCGGDRLTRANYDKINLGMTLQEVEEILGPGQDTIGINMPELPSRRGTSTSKGGVLEGTNPPRWLVWEKDKRSIRIGFRDDKVVLKFQQGL
jgi:hypothetical protein